MSLSFSPVSRLLWLLGLGLAVVGSLRSQAAFCQTSRPTSANLPSSRPSPEKPQTEIGGNPTDETEKTVTTGSLQTILRWREAAPKRPPESRQGVIDLRLWPLETRSIGLRGEWGFFWKQFRPPTKLGEPGTWPSQGGIFVREPSSWRGFTLGGQKLPSDGYATYALKLRYRPEESRRYGLYIHLVYSSYRLWLNGTLVGEEGQIGISPKDVVAHQRPRLYELPGDKSEVLIVLHISNFAHREGGLRHPIVCGEKNLLRKEIAFPLELEVFLMGILLIFGLYHLICFLIYPQEKPLFWLAIFCFLLSIRVFFAGRLWLGEFFPWLPFEWIFRIEYLTFFIGFSVCVTMIHSMYWKETIGRLQTFFEGVGWAGACVILLFPTKVFSWLLLPFQLTVLFGVFYCLWIFVLTRKKAGAKILLVGLGVISLFVLHDLWFHISLSQGAVKHGPFSEWTPFGALILALSFSIALFWRAVQAFHAVEEAHRDLIRLNEAYGRFVPHGFLTLLEKRSITDVKLGDHVQREMTIMFSDIRAFTSLSESITPQENFHFLNDYLQGMEDAINQCKGMIDKYIGDGIMALFPEGPDSALHAGLAMLRTLEVFNHQRVLRDQTAIEIGIGVNTGLLMLGTIGGERRMDGTVISDAVNLASRIEGMTKLYGCPLLITEATWKAVCDPSPFRTRKLDRIAVKGKTQSLWVYEIFNADPVEKFEQKKRTLPLFLEALDTYHERRFEEAEALFLSCLQQAPQDTVPLLYIERCQALRRDPPPPSWDGTYRATHKG